ncbi:M18 family aminopeptidase [Desulfopila sp. IMCC35008]|uniref:M18 family aminopeptidase n=1 Tax=Desulfopila sp. IMCC35008 TaxID=2653858 RepID=UPI0013D5820D|nr:M18 family aminopeptidase [Desulfopila sp. IMCC35008]
MFTNSQDYNKDLFGFLQQSPTAFHTTRTIQKRLVKAGFKELDESKGWKLKPENGYFVVRDNSAICAFTLGKKQIPSDGFRMTASHNDSPGLQIKPVAAIESPPYLQLGVEVYGSPLLHQWFDRDLGLAGRVCAKTNAESYQEFLIDFKRPLLTIPTVAIHLDREANTSKSIDKQKLLPPLLAQKIGDQLPNFHEILLQRIKKQYPKPKISKILSFDLFCYDSQAPAFLGLNNEFIAAGRLDNQLSCHAGVMALCQSSGTMNSMFICTNHEENGSTSVSGANSSFVTDIFSRIIPDPEQRYISLRNSFLVSMDNAHGVHPNYMELSDPNHSVNLNEGLVIKINANQRYATNSRSSARFKLIAEKAGVPVQEFVMRSDMPCGSTVGPMTAAKLGVDTIDIGVPTFGMHSIREITGSSDPYMLYQTIIEFLQ